MSEETKNPNPQTPPAQEPNTAAENANPEPVQEEATAQAVADSEPRSEAQPQAESAAETTATETSADEADEKDLSSQLLDSEDVVYTDEERAQMEEWYGETIQEFHAGSIITGKVVSVSDREVSVDIGFKSDGIIPHDEIDNIQDLQIGQELEVYIDKMEDSDGQLLLSKKKADFERTWQKILSLYEENATIEGRCLRRIKGGIVVEVLGVDAFMPGSQIDIHPIQDFDALIGKKLDFKIIKINEARKNIVVSRKVIIEEDMKEVREKVLKELEVGQVREGVVKNITNFGVFVDLGGVDGLLHITDLSWGRINHPSDVVQLNQKIAVKILDYDPERKRISIGYKQLQPHPWDNIENRFPVNSKVKGKVVSITKYGVFVELEPGVEGLIHISEMSWTQHIKHPSQLVNIGEEVEVMVLDIQKEQHKISLGLKQVEPNPWIEYEAKYVTGSRHTGIVRELMPFGVFVELEDNVDGLVHISDLSWTKNIRHPAEVVKKGQKMDVVVLNFDRDERRISLGYKQLFPNPWEQFVDEHKIGDVFSATISKVIDKGVLVSVNDELEGFVPNSKLKLVDDEGKRRSPREGESIMVKVIECDPNSKKLILSAQEARMSQEERNVAEYRSMQHSSPSGTTLGDAIGGALLKSRVDGKEDKGKEPAAPAAEAETAPEETAAEGKADAEESRADSDEEAKDTEDKAEKE